MRCTCAPKRSSIESYPFSLFCCFLSPKCAILSIGFCIFFYPAFGPFNPNAERSRRHETVPLFLLYTLTKSIALCLFIFNGLNVLAQCADSNANGTCDDEETGCTIELACNYDAAAVIPDPAACDFVSALRLVHGRQRLQLRFWSELRRRNLRLAHSLRSRRGMFERRRWRWRVR